jgi:CheY-like chemotaxis protein
MMDSSKSLNGKRVFIVEDEMIQAVILEKTIEKFGFEIVGRAKSGEKAIKMIEELRPDIITMDIQLEDTIDGINVADKVQQHYLPEVIFITGNSDSLNYSRAKEVGFVAFITKPVQVEELKKALEKCVLIKEKGAA